MQSYANDKEYALMRRQGGNVESKSGFSKLSVLVTSGICLLNWVTWIILICRHWHELRDGSQFVAVALLVLLPFPCIQMFRAKEGRLPSAFYTYLLLVLAVRLTFH
jgi:hypothetical protein